MDGPHSVSLFRRFTLVCSAAHLHKRVLSASGHIYEVLLRTLVEYENSAEMGGRGRGLLTTSAPEHSPVAPVTIRFDATHAELALAGMRPLTDTANLILELVRRSLDVGDAEGTLYQLELLVERVRSIVSQPRSLLRFSLPSGLQWRHCQCETHPDTYATVGHSGLGTEWESHCELSMAAEE